MRISALLLLKLEIIAIAFGVIYSSQARAVELATIREESTEPSLTGGGDSWDSMVTPDGRYVVFASAANNLALSASQPL